MWLRQLKISVSKKVKEVKFRLLFFKEFLFSRLTELRLEVFTTKHFVSISLIFALFIALCLPAYAAEADTVEPAERISAEELFADIDPVKVETTCENGRKITVTTYILDNGEIVTDTFERGLNFARSYEGSDTASRTVDFTAATFTLTASFKWWTSSGTPGAIGSWQSVECTSAYGSYSIKKEDYTVSDWIVSHTDGPVSFGKAHASVYGKIHPKTTTSAVGNECYLYIYCDDVGTISDKHK